MECWENPTKRLTSGMVHLLLGLTASRLPPRMLKLSMFVSGTLFWFVNNTITETKGDFAAGLSGSEDIASLIDVKQIHTALIAQRMIESAAMRLRRSVRLLLG